MVSFSVVIPTYNREAFLPQAVASVANQEVRAELLVVDDGSTDNTEALIRSMRIPGMRYLKKENGGVASAINLGVRLSRGDYIIPLGSDDALAPGILKRYARAATSRPDLDVLYGNMILTDMKLNVLGGWNYEDWDGRIGELMGELVRNMPIAQSGSAFHRRLYERFGMYDESLSRGSDHDHISRIAPHALFKHMAGPSLFCRTHDDNISRKTPVFRECKARVTRRIIKRYGLERLFPAYGWEDDPDAARARAHADLVRIFEVYDDQESIALYSAV
ncbi:glycosyltransferase [Salidesulfovibrio onnuriiensis]|uniref:glycosyltransferase n=1 Tax=Salidesulfovibrio onnuriiensis TaxID=2583823 RepID=UPI00164FABD3|nr:glycosyltransferase [Salidesulfovibrio onnuriiensis]